MDNRSPLHIDGWRATNLLVTILSKEAAVSAEAIHGTLEILHGSEELAKFPPLPPIDQWLALYRHHAQICNVLVDGFFPSGNPAMKTSTVIATLLKAHRAFCRASNGQREAIIQRASKEQTQRVRQGIAQGMRAVVADQSQFIRDDIAGRMTKKDEQIIARLWRTPEMQFFFRVWMPCMVVNDMTPVELMRKARLGASRHARPEHINALCDLLRLDKAAIAEPCIARYFADSYAVEGRAAFKRMAKALATPSKTLRPSQVKGYLSGYISKIASASGAPIESPLIGDLFDRVARDYGRSDTTDRDLPTGEALTKSVQRHRKRWPKIPGPPKVDKNRA